MNNYWQHVLLFIKRIIILLLLYTISRLFFFLLNKEYFSDISLLRLLLIFVAGIRFDIAAIAFINIVFILLLIPGNIKNNEVIQKTGTVIFFIINGMALMSNFIDARFFDFINKRSTSAIFSLMGANKDTWMMIPRFIVDYWYVVVTYTVIMIAFWKWMPVLNFKKIIKENLTWLSFGYQMFIFAALAGLLLLGFRGTGLKPISITTAASYTELKNVPLVINTPFSIIKTVENENLNVRSYFNDSIALDIYNPVYQYHTDTIFKKRNIVIIILESFSKEYSGYLSENKSYTPNLDSILHESLVFTDAFANGTQSYEALPAIIAGIPSLMDRPYSGSNYADNLIDALPAILSSEGYHTSFFHGGNNGTMGFDHFAKVAGTEQYFGRNEYNNDADYDRSWGIWDEPFLQYFARTINTFNQPFFSSVFTLSSHHPYKVPQKYEGRFPEGELRILKSIGYADYALGKFFQTAKEMPWFNNTLFVLTADHAAQSVDKEYYSSTDRYTIPLAFYCPSDTLLKGRNPQVAQQIDILPSVLAYIGYNKPFFSFGTNLLNSAADHFAVNYVNGNYQYTTKNYLMIFNGRDVVSFSARKVAGSKDNIMLPDDQLQEPDHQSLEMIENKVKAYIQIYTDCMINNRMSVTTFRHTSK